MAFALVVAAAATAAAPSAAAYETRPEAPAGRPLSALAPGVEIADHPQRDAIVLSKPVGGQRGGELHLRAVVDRRSGAVSWQVRHELVHVDRHKDVRAVRFTSGGARHRIVPLAVEHGHDDCPPTDAVGFCNRTTRITFELPERALRELVASYRRGASDPWLLRFENARGKDITASLSPADAVGLLRALDLWRTQAD